MVNRAGIIATLLEKECGNEVEVDRVMVVGLAPGAAGMEMAGGAPLCFWSRIANGIRMRFELSSRRQGLKRTSVFENGVFEKSRQCFTGIAMREGMAT